MMKTQKTGMNFQTGSNINSPLKIIIKRSPNFYTISIKDVLQFSQHLLHYTTQTYVQGDLS